MLQRLNSLPFVLLDINFFGFRAAQLTRRLDAFDQKPVIYPAHPIHGTCHQSGLHCMSHVSTAGQPPVTSLVKLQRLKLFGQIARAEPVQDHARALQTSISRLPEDWRHPRGRTRQSWLRTVKADLKPLSFGLYTACRHAADRSAWQSVMETAMLVVGCAIP